MGRKDVEEVENEEIQELLTDFEAVWQRVSPPTEVQNTPPLSEPEYPAAVRTARWFPEL